LSRPVILPCEGFDLASIPSPCFVVDTASLTRNLEILDELRRRAGCDILLALKGFAMFSVFPLCRKYLSGTTASSLWEARLGREEFGDDESNGQVHACVPAYRADEFDELMGIVDHVTFNSFSQWRRFRDELRADHLDVQVAIRVNPEYSEIDTAIYDPCAPCSRLGVTRDQFLVEELDGVSGLHFHSLCEQGADVLERTLAAFVEKFGEFLPRMSWVNFGGGHHVTRADYDLDRAVRVISEFRERFDVEVFLEPGEAIGLETGVLVAEVLDVIHNRMPIAILDTSASTHMPDVLEMPYRPRIRGAGDPDEKAHTFRLGGLTCLAGDVIGDYSFDEPLEVGDRLIFEDMAHYTMVKTTNFNGVALPSIGIYHRGEDRFELVRSPKYTDYRDRLS